jgi:hypothetical protein
MVHGTSALHKAAATLSSYGPTRAAEAGLVPQP